MPVILTIPVVLFLIGLLENVFSAATLPHHLSHPVIIAAALSSTTIFSVGMVLFYALVHAYRHPEKSPFRTTLTQVIRTFVYHMSSPLPLHIRALLDPIVLYLKSLFTAQPFSRVSRLLGTFLRYLEPFLHYVQALSHWVATYISLSIFTRQLEGQDEPQWAVTDADRLDQYLPVVDYAYHTALQATHDDDALDQAAAALASICGHFKTREFIYLKQKQAGYDAVILSGLETKSLIHLLSPEASYRCNLTAADCLSMLNSIETPGIS